MIPFIFSCGRNHLLKATYDSLLEKYGSIIEQSIVIEDPCINSEFPDIKIKEKVRHPAPSGLSFSFYKAYSTFQSEFYLHMEDDWIANVDLDLNKVEQLMIEHNIDQVYLSSKKKADNPKISKFEKIDLGDSLLVLGEVSGHMIPNTTPSIMRKTMFENYINGYSNIENKKLSPMKTWKFWRKNLGKKKYAVIVGKENTMLTHIGDEMRIRATDNGSAISGGRDLFYTVGFGEKYLKLANNLAESFRIFNYKHEFIILSDRDLDSKFAKVINVSSDAPPLLDNHLKWNLDSTIEFKINPILAKIYIDKYINIKEYRRITFVDADSVLTKNYKDFVYKMNKDDHIWVSRINKNRSIFTCLSYYKKKYNRFVTNLVPALGFDEKQLAEIKKRKGVCAGFFSFVPAKNPDLFELLRKTYEENQPTTDQECFNFLLAKNIISCRIKKDIFFSDSSLSGQGLLHFTSHKRECLRLLNKIKAEKNQPVIGHL